MDVVECCVVVVVFGASVVVVVVVVNVVVVHWLSHFGRQRRQNILLLFASLYILFRLNDETIHQFEELIPDS